MAETLQRPVVPTRHRLDVDAYYKMAETGILKRAERVELIDGEIIDMPPIGSPHAGRVNRLTRFFGRATAEGLVVLAVQNPLRLDAHNEPQPDLMLLRPRADTYTESHPTAADVLLLVEVSGNSLAFDRGVKLPLYAKFAIPEVWIIDLDGKAVEVCRDPQDGAYKSIERLTSGAVSPLLVSGISIDVQALLA